MSNLEPLITGDRATFSLNHLFVRSYGAFPCVLAMPTDPNHSVVGAQLKNIACLCGVLRRPCDVFFGMKNVDPCRVQREYPI
jgi:hypothetical protein